MMVAIQRMVRMKRKKEMQNSIEGGHQQKINPKKVNIESFKGNQRMVNNHSPEPIDFFVNFVAAVDSVQLIPKYK